VYYGVHLLGDTGYNANWHRQSYFLRLYIFYLYLVHICHKLSMFVLWKRTFAFVIEAKVSDYDWKPVGRRLAPSHNVFWWSQILSKWFPLFCNKQLVVFLDQAVHINPIISHLPLVFSVSVFSWYYCWHTPPPPPSSALNPTPDTCESRSLLVQKPQVNFSSRKLPRLFC
jgi:hypothetical protein